MTSYFFFDCEKYINSCFYFNVLTYFYQKTIQHQIVSYLHLIASLIISTVLGEGILRDEIDILKKFCSPLKKKEKKIYSERDSEQHCSIFVTFSHKSKHIF